MYQALVLLPGLICDARLRREVVAGLADGVAPMVADLTLDDSIPAMAARTLAAAPPRFALAGLSMGGYVALEIMRKAPERVTHLALLDTSARADDTARRDTRRKAMALAEDGKFIDVTRRLIGNLVVPEHVGGPIGQEVQAMSERVGKAAYLRQQQAIIDRIDSRPFLKNIAVPTLVGVGEDDQLTPPELAAEMAEAVAGAELVHFPDSAHLPTMENPEAVVEAMRGWLGR